MDRRMFIIAASCGALVAPPLNAFAHMGVLLVYAEPGVGLTVTGPVRELRLHFDQGVLAAASRV
jgi:hypothetical protein